VYEAWAPGHIPVAHDRRQAVGGRVDRGSEACGPGPDDDEVVMRPLRRLQATPGLGDRLDGRRRESSVAVDEDGESRIDQPEALEQEVGLGRPCLMPLVRLSGAREEIAKTVVLGVHPPTHDLHPWVYRAHISIVVRRYRPTDRGPRTNWTTIIVTFGVSA
jgi:hypothetical protein